MTPGACFATAVELLDEIRAAGRRPADAVASAFFRQRRYIGGGDRRQISWFVWGVLRHFRRLCWHLARVQGSEEIVLEAFLPKALPPKRTEASFSSRALCLAFAVMKGWKISELKLSLAQGKYAASPMTQKEILWLEPLEGADFAHPEQPPEVQGEYPDWLRPFLEESFGSAENCVKEVKAMQAEAPLDVRVNLLKATRQEAVIKLKKEGFPAEFSVLCPWGIRLPPRSAVMSLPCFQDGMIEIQDEGSQIVALLADAKPGERVVDYCAGAGGKTMAMAMNMENRGRITACDVSDVRLKGAIKRLRRAGVHNVQCHLLTEGDKWVKRHRQDFDLVIVDAPCTGTGTWRRNPDARRTLEPIDLEEISQKQTEILRKAASLVRAGGRLLYATCSVLKRENEAQIEQFLAENSEFDIFPVKKCSSELPEILRKQLQEDGYLRLTPAQHGSDGFFACLLQRKSLPESQAEK